MPTSVALSSHFEMFIREQINSDRYNNASEVVRADLHTLEEREQQLKLDALRIAVDAGISSGKGRSAEEVFNRLSGKYRQMADNENAE